MQYRKLLKILELIYEISDVTVDEFVNRERWKSFHLTKFTLGFIDENYEKFDKCLSDIQKLHPGISLSEISKEVIPIIEDSLLLNGLDQNEVRILSEKWDNIPDQQWFVAAGIRGITDADTPQRLGAYHIYDLKKNAELPEELSSIPEKDNYKDRFGSNYVVGVYINAKSPARAIELGNEQFRIFENTLRFILNENRSWSSIGILEYHSPYTISTVACSKSRYHLDYKYDGSDHFELLTNHKLTNHKYGYNRIWEIVSNKESTELAKRILRSVTWIGHALNDTDVSRAFLLLLIAVESLLKVQDDSIIRPSIVHSISESIAFILSDDKTKRLEIYKEYKNLYGLRSKIVHEGSNNISELELRSIQQYSRSVIIKLLTEKKFKEFKGKEDLRKFYLNERFK